MEYIIPKVLDTSALLKILIPGRDEVGTEYLDNWRRDNFPLYTLSFCLTEVLGIVKRDYFKSTKDYIFIMDTIQMWIEHRTIKIIEHDPFIERTFEETRDIVERYKIDFVDALQITFHKFGKFKNFRSKSRPILITADESLAKSAIKEGVKAWYCLEPYPY